jgi:hypothetical protein
MGVAGGKKEGLLGSIIIVHRIVLAGLILQGRCNKMLIIPESLVILQTNNQGFLQLFIQARRKRIQRMKKS